MVTDGSSFYKRAQKFQIALKLNKYPNANSLSKECGCSRNTAQRTIYKLRDDYMMPIEYDPTERGYYLVDQNYTLPTELPPGKDELVALLLAREIVSNLEAADLNKCLDEFWLKFSANNPSVIRDLEPLTRVFSSDSTVIGEMADKGILDFLFAADRGESVEIVYRSPWRHTEDKTYRGKILRVHTSDGLLYLLFKEESGREIILNTSFIKQFTVLNFSLEIKNSPEGETTRDNWLEGFGIWAGEEIEEIEVQILPPASRYYAAQKWHDDQEDTFDGEVLVRKIPSIVSPEIVRRVLSIGKFIKSVKPDSLLNMVKSEAETLLKELDKKQ